MATVLDTFITRFGFETDKTGLNEAKKGLADFKSGAIKIAAAVGNNGVIDRIALKQN